MDRHLLPRMILVLAVTTAANSCSNDRAQTAPTGAMVMTTTIVIANSGATNLIGYRVLIAPSGSASYQSSDGNGQATLPASLRDALLRDIDAAKPLANLDVGPGCAKSASFGTSTTIEVGGDRSPDISCPGGPKAQALNGDIAAIVSFLHVRNVLRARGRELPPQVQ